MPDRPAAVRPAQWSTTAIIAIEAVFFLGICYYQLFAHHEWHSVIEYDDGVWFGSAVRLADGVVPYRRFVLDQPPGVAVLMVPFGVLSRISGTRAGFAAARLFVPVVGAAGVVAAGWLVRHRGRLAVAVGGGTAAVCPVVLFDARTVMLEPFCALFCMLGLIGVFDRDRITDCPRRLLWAGVAFGLAVSCKGFAIVPLAVVVAALLLGHDRRRRLPPLLAGAVGAVVVVCGPFFALDPRQFAHQVVATQLLRSQKENPSIWDRIFSLVGVLPATGSRQGVPGDSHPADVAVLVVLAALVIGGWATTRPRPLDLVAVAVVGGSGFALVQPPAFYDHYAAFFVPFLAVSLGLSAALLGLRRPRLIAVLATVALAAGVVHTVHTVRAQPGQGYGVAPLDALVPAGACVVSDNAPVLLLANRFTSTRPGCSSMVDAYGTTISTGDGRAPTSYDAAAVAAWEQVFSRAGYIVLFSGYSPRRIPWTPTLRAYVGRYFRTLQPTQPTVLVRRTTP